MPAFYIKGRLFNQGVNQETSGLYCLSVGHYSKALEYFNNAIIMSENNYYFYEARAFTLSMLEKYDLAINDINKYLISYQYNGSQGTLQGSEAILFSYAYCLAKSGNYYDADSNINKYLSRMPHDKRARYSSAIIKIKSGLISLASEELNLALNKQEGDFSHLYLKHEKNDAYLLLNIINSGESILEEYLRINHQPYFFQDVKLRALRERNWRLQQSRNVGGLGKANYIDYATCKRCQMSPCHCSDPDID